jgi:hypothetical protein
MAVANPHSDPDPIDEEIERILVEDPALLARLADYDRRRAAGELELVPHDEAMRRLGFDRRSE